MSLTPGERAQMDEAAAEVDRAFSASRGPVSAAVWQPATYFPPTDAAKAIYKQFVDQEERARAWATVERMQVEDGHADFAWWVRAGKLYAKFAAEAAGLSWNAGAFSVVENTARQTKETLAKIPNPKLWPEWVKWVVGGAVAVAVLAVAAPYVRLAGAVA